MSPCEICCYWLSWILQEQRENASYKNKRLCKKKIIKKIRTIAVTLLTGGAKASECRAQADAKRATSAAEAQGGTVGRGCRGVREEGATLRRVGDRARAVEGAGGEAAAGWWRLLLLRLGLRLRH